MMLVGTSSAWAAAYLSGGFNSWGAQAFSNGTCSISLNANTTYEFKIRASNTNWNTSYGNNGTMTSTNCTDWLMSTSAGNCKITTDGAGTYVFAYMEAYASYSASDFKTAMQGAILYYELATPEEYILDNPIPDTFQSYKGGTLMQLPQNTATPTTAPHAMDITYSIDAAGILTGLPQNYVSKESLQAMLNAMQSAGLFASYTMTYNATTKKYDFTFTANS
jgi:hypothetical protein